MYHIDYTAISRYIDAYRDISMYCYTTIIELWSNYEINGTFYAYIFGVVKRSAAGLVCENVNYSGIYKMRTMQNLTKLNIKTLFQ